MAGMTFSGSYSTSLVLTNVAYNPSTITGTIDVTAGIALAGAAGTVWTIEVVGQIRTGR